MSAEKIKIRRIGNSLGIILPQTALSALNLGEGDELFLSESSMGYTLTPYDPKFAEALEDAREFMKTHRNAFKELAK